MIGMALDAGGHLTHGFRRNISGKMFDQRSYGTDPERACSTTPPYACWHRNSGR